MFTHYKTHYLLVWLTITHYFCTKKKMFTNVKSHLALHVFEFKEHLDILNFLSKYEIALTWLFLITQMCFGGFSESGGKTTNLSRLRPGIRHALRILKYWSMHRGCLPMYCTGRLWLRNTMHIHDKLLDIWANIVGYWKYIALFYS